MIKLDLDAIANRAYLHDATGDGTVENIVHAHHLPQLLGRLGPADSSAVLEMGFGEGTITAPLLAAGYRVELVEGSPTLCKQAQERFGDALKVHCSYFENFLPTERFSRVLSLHVLEHVDNPELVVARMRDWLAPGGKLIAVVPNAESLHRQLAVMMGLQPQIDSLGPRDHLVGHQRVFTLASLTALLEAAGFQIEEQFGYFVKVVPNSMMSGWRPDLIQGLTEISGQMPARLLANIGVVATLRA